MLTTKTANTVSADIIIPLYPVGRICLLSNTTKEIERSAAIESDDIRVAFAISLAAVDRLELIPICVPRPEKIRMLTTKTANTVSADIIIPLYPLGRICLFSITTKEIERRAAMESEEITVAFAIISAAVDRLELIPICVPRPEKIRMLTTKTANTVNADIIIPLYPLGRICLFNITTKEIERRAAMESEEITVAFAIISAAVDRLELIPICVPRPEKIRMLTTKTANTVNADIIIPLYPLGRICLFNITTKEIERRAAMESEEITVAFAIISAAVDRLELIPICVPRPEKIRMLTTKTANTVNADIIIPLYPLGRICLFNITTKEIERRAAMESEEITVAFAIISAAVDRLELIPICVPRPEKIRMLTTKTANTVNADIIIPLYPLGRICLFSITTKEIERRAAMES